MAVRFTVEDSRNRVAFVAGTIVVTTVARCLRELRRPGKRERLRHVMRGERPDPDVDDRTMADRIRSRLGPLEHRLDVPKVHVMVTNHIASLHGEVARTDQAVDVERAVDTSLECVGSNRAYVSVCCRATRRLPAAALATRHHRRRSDGWRPPPGAEGQIPTVKRDN